MEVMQQSDIRREAVLAIASFDQESINIGAEALAVLGYAGMSEVIASQEDVEKKPIGAALASLGIEILNKSDVEKYHAQHRKEVAQRTFAEWLQSEDSNKSSKSWGSYSSPHWEKMEINEYKQPVPEFVLNKAIQIKKAVPDCQIMIEFLNESPDPFLLVRTPMPMYSYSNPAEQYYIEVWNEPKFEGRVR